MKKICKRVLNRIVEMRLRNKIIGVVGLLLILLIPLNPQNVDVIITYGEEVELEGNNAILYIDSGNGWNDQEGYVASVKRNNTCTVHVKSYDTAFSARLDPVDAEKTVTITRIEIRTWGITQAVYQGSGLEKVFNGSINVDSISIDDGVAKIVPINEDPEIYMSASFCKILALAMQMGTMIKVLIILILCVALFCRFAKKDVKPCSQKQRILSMVIGCVVCVSIVAIWLSSVKVVVTYQNKDELQYDVSQMWVHEDEGWQGAWTGSIKGSGEAIFKVPQRNAVEWIRIDPVASEHPVAIEKIEIKSLGRTKVAYSGQDLAELIEYTINVDEVFFDGKCVNVIPTNEDSQIVFGEEICDDLASVMMQDRVLKLAILFVFAILIAVCGCFLEKWNRQFIWIKKRGVAIASIAIVVGTVAILFADLISGDYKFTYTNILYQIEPFRSLGVATKGLGASDMADGMFPEIVQLYKNGAINDWMSHNVFGYTSLNEMYIMSPFMWLCYGITSAGQLIRYLIKDALALVGMYLFLRNIGCKKAAAWIGGTIYVFSSVMVMWGSWPQTDVACLAPMLFYVTNRLLETWKEKSNKVVWYWLSIAFILCLMFVAGMPIYALFFLYLGVAYEVFNMIAVHKFKWQEIATCIIMIALAVILAGFMSFAYTGNLFFSTQGYQEYRIESGYPTHAAHISFLLSFFVPQSALSGGSAIEYNVFSGIFILFMIPAYFITPKDKKKTFWGISILVILFFVFSKYSGYIYKYIPFINSSRKTRMIVLLNFGISILSALLISQLQTVAVEKKRAKIACIVWAIFCIGEMVLLWYNKETTIYMQIIGMILCVALALISMVALVCSKKSAIPIMTLTATIAISGAIFARNGLQLIDADADVIPSATESIEYLQEVASGEYRMASVGAANFIPQLNNYYDINNLCAHVFVNTEEKVKIYLEAIDSDIYDIATKTSIKNVDNWNLLYYSGIKYLLIQEDDLEEFDFADTEYELHQFDDGECVIELKDIQSRTYIATNVQTVATEDDVLEAMKAEYIPNTIYTTERLDSSLSATLDESSCEIIEEGNNRIEIQANVDGSSYVVLSDYCTDNWKAYVNGEEQKLISCNYLFGAVYLDEPGEYTIELVYHNQEKNLYRMISLISCGVFVVIMLMHKKIARMMMYFPKIAKIDE